MATIEQTFMRLEKSEFRRKFHLSLKDKAYITEKGMDTIREHAIDFVRTRLAPADIPNDGKQTPMKGHPVFVAQHACACCCRGCLLKWYKVPQNRELTEEEQRRIANLLMAWIEKEMKMLDFRRADESAVVPDDVLKTSKRFLRQNEEAYKMLAKGVE